MVVDITQGLVFTGVGKIAIDGVQALLHAAVNLIPVAGPLLWKLLHLVV